MASAVLTSQNEWSHMAKLPNNHNNRLNPNPNSNSFSKKKHHRRPAADHSPAVTQANSDDAYSFNQKPDFADFNFNPGSYICFDVSNYTKSEILHVRERLVAELDSVRRISSLIESGKLNKQKKKRLNSIDPVKNPKKLRREVNFSPLEIENLLKMCKTVLAKLMKHKLSWVFNKPVDAVSLGLHDYHEIVKQPMDLGTVKANLAKNMYLSPLEFADHVRLTFNNAMLYNPQGDEVHKMADLLLDRFEELFGPIQAKFKVENLDNNVGNNLENNLEIDELQGSSWNVSPIHEKPKKLSKTKPKTKQKPIFLPVEVLEAPIPIPFPNPPLKKTQRVETMLNNSGKAEIVEKTESLQNIESLQKAESLPVLEPVHNPPQSPPKQQVQPKPTVVRERLPKLPKPKAKDPNKRAMSTEEQHKLSIGLQNLPQEKMGQLLHIIKKRNAHMVQDGDEIELDIEAIDTETLWELDRFVMNVKKMVSKTKRQALMVNNNSGFAPVEAETTASGDDNVVSASERSEGGKKMKEVEGGEDEVNIGDDVDVGAEVDLGGDVDIGDDVPMSSFPPVEIENEKEEGVGAIENNPRAASSSSSSSGSSSSGSSSSSDSDSGSSSGSDSDANDAQSKGNPSKLRLEE